MAELVWKPALKSTKAVFTLIVEFDEIPPDEDLTELTDTARGSGCVQKAELMVLSPYTKSY